MVKVIRKVGIVDFLKDVYHKPFWDRLKHIWSEFRESNQVVAAYTPIAVITCIPLFIAVWYGKVHANPVPKYYDHINIYRPDDPRAALIRKDDCLKYSISHKFDTVYIPSAV